jgi:hypothetical protein
MANRGHNHSREHDEGRGPSGMWKPHKDWRVWVALVLMLVAVAAYVLSMDDSILPR